MPATSALHEHRAQLVDEEVELDVVLPVLGQDLVHGRDREDPVDGVAERLLRVDIRRPRLQPQQRGDRLQVVLDAVVDLLGEHAAQRHPPVLERDGGLARDRLEQLAVVVREGRVAVDDELADRPPAPAQRQAHRERARAALRPRDAAVLEHDRRAGRARRLDGRLHDRLQRLLDVERLGDRLRDPRERLQLEHATLRLRVELRVLDRLRHLARDRHQQVDLGLGERPRLARPHVECALELVAREDRHREDRGVVVLGQVGKRLEARVEMRVGGDHHRRPIGGGGARDPLATSHARRLRLERDARAVGRAQDELVGALVVEVDVGRVGLERRGHLVRDRLHHLLQVERRVHDLGRAREEREVPGRLAQIRSPSTRAPRIGTRIVSAKREPADDDEPSPRRRRGRRAGAELALEPGAEHVVVEERAGDEEHDEHRLEDQRAVEVGRVARRRRSRRGGRVSQRPDTIAIPIALQPSGRQRRPSVRIAVARASPSRLRIAGTPTKTSATVPPTQTVDESRWTMRRVVITEAGYRRRRVTTAAPWLS